MSNNSRNPGFTLIEVLIAIVILMVGLVPLASIFAYSTSTNMTTNQATTATFLAEDMIEEFRNLPMSSATLNAGGGLNPDSPTSGYFDYVSVAPDGVVTSDTTSTGAPFIRLWQINGTNPKTVTVVIYATVGGMGRQRIEAMRSSTILANR